ncbi:MAG: acetyl-CoA carboxylase biotin carboxylase subunit [Candidatus Sericytochromatia bacterium]|nr:acetyl-CoA carboxylase biotin carboxylase subunit [Candidatus Sericytochromatia bacterium]
MFSKILIANRGEIALRVIRACQSLGIATVAVYSEADAQAPHVLAADEAFLIGPPPVPQSYLNAAKILEVAQSCGAQAIHPGYGLLSENADFAAAWEAVEITFIGPSPKAIAAMGDKIAARAMMAKAGVPVVPGSGPIVDPADALAFAEQIGYPVMVKASAGGGGIGMQLVETPAELEKAVKMCGARAKTYFGSDVIYLEKAILKPRHIEVQILADHFDNVVILHERECSIQRRHQKVIEECPSPGVSPEQRRFLTERAIAATRAIGYANAGTLEFLMDADGNFYFLEMNTRLQVEHPVTEMVTGLDIVAWQIRIAAGDRLTFSAAPLNGHAIECRLYAEDPVTFMPQPGTLTRFEPPAGEGLRHDVGVVSGSVVTPFYDPMLGKLIAWGSTRTEAIERLRDALARYEIAGIKTNLPLLQTIVDSPAFAAADLDTGFISRMRQTVTA